MLHQASSLRLSQNSLTLLEYCPRRFQYVVLDRLLTSSPPHLLEGQLWGNRFHLMMQQQEMGLLTEAFIDKNSDFQASIKALKLADTDLFKSRERVRESEYEQAFNLNGYRFTVVYDLLRIWEDRGEIVDWKTYLKPKKNADLQKNWQTRLYLYALVESTELSPSQVTMTYWFVRTHDQVDRPLQPEFVCIAYSQGQHLRTRQELSEITGQLTEWLHCDEPLPRIPRALGRCEVCPFFERCWQHQEGDNSEFTDLPEPERIEELML